MGIRTVICDLLEVEHPILLAGMGGVAGPELAAAVSNAGGLGVLGAAGVSPEGLKEWIKRTRELTDRPFGVDTLLPASVPQSMPTGAGASGSRGPLIPPEVLEARDRFMQEQELNVPQSPTPARGARRGGGGFVRDFFEAQLEVVLDQRVPLYVSGLGDPGPEFIGKAHSFGMRVMTVVGNVRHAEKSSAAGVDAVVAQGTDGGGHNSPVGTMALLPQVVDAVDPLPVIGAGGIVDGRGIAAAFMLGAVGVWLGTVFLATEESALPRFQKEAVVAATERDTIVSRSVTGKPARMIRGAWAELHERGEIEALPMPLQSIVSGPVTRAAMMHQRADVWPGFAGQGAGMVRRIRPAAEIVAELVDEASDRLAGTKLPGVTVNP